MTGVFLIVSLMSFSQEIAENAIGLRLGGGNGFGAEISYQHALSNNNRLEVDLGWASDRNFDGFKLIGIYQWVWALEDNFNWYAGPGAGIGNYDYEVPGFNDISDTFFLIAGQIGIEYNFDDIPLQLSVDSRLELGFGDITDDVDLGIAAGVRYQF